MRRRKNGRMAQQERRRFRVDGVVQGVGFRWFVHGLASRLALGGFVLNDGQGVVVEAEGTPEALDSLATALRNDAPALARVDSVVAEPLPTLGDSGFEIRA
jgi:hydrogenase maturation protein HypF